MLYKVTPMLPAPESKQRKPKQEGQAPRKRRATAIYDAEGSEVLITLMCLKCRTVKPLAQFGLRKMADGAIRNQPWCRPCRSGAGVKGKKPALVPTEAPATEALAAPAHAPEVPVSMPAPVAALTAVTVALPEAADASVALEVPELVEAEVTVLESMPEPAMDGGLEPIDDGSRSIGLE